jgi:hypothetical protein
MKTKTANKATSTPASTGVGLCADGKAHSFKQLAPDGNYNGGKFFYAEREIEGADGKMYTEKFRDYGAAYVFCAKCTTKVKVK